MKVIRPITHNDFDAYHGFAQRANVGIRNLPKNPDLLREKIINSELTFSEKAKDPYRTVYIFVLEDLETSTLGGTCSILARTGGYTPLYYYLRETYTSQNPLVKSQEVLRPTILSNGPTEVCALYLAPEYRHEGLGRLISLCRFLFMAAHPEKFTETIFAEIRGMINSEGNFPFWEGLGKHFLDLSFSEVNALIEKDQSFIPDFLPRYPVYTELLSPETRASLGEVQQNSKPALHLLEEEGFSKSSHIDIFDGGPMISASRNQIRSIRDSRLGTIVDIIPNSPTSSSYLLSNNSLDFRACLSTLEIKGQTLIIDEATSLALKVNIGDTIRYVTASSH